MYIRMREHHFWNILIKFRAAPCHAMSWLHVPCHILACYAMPYFGMSWRVLIIPCHATSVFFWKNAPGIFEKCLQLVGTWVQNASRKLAPYFFHMPSASGYMGAKYFQKIGPIFLARLTNGSGSEYIQFVIPWDIQSIRGRDFGVPHNFDMALFANMALEIKAWQAT